MLCIEPPTAPRPLGFPSLMPPHLRCCALMVQSSKAASARRSPCEEHSNKHRPGADARSALARWRAAPSCRTLEQIGNQCPLSIGQVGAVMRAGLASMGPGVVVALRDDLMSGCRTLDTPALGHQAHDALGAQGPADRCSAHPHGTSVLKFRCEFVQRRMRHLRDDGQQQGYLRRCECRWPSASIHGLGSSSICHIALPSPAPLGWQHDMQSSGRLISSTPSKCGTMFGLAKQWAGPPSALH